MPPSRTAAAPAAAALLAVSVAALAAGCRSPARPAPPAPALRAPVAPPPAVPDLASTLDAYPLGDQAFRTDLLATSPQRSLHLVQTRGPILPHSHPARTERVYVLAGHGSVLVDGRSFPLAPGVALKFDRGVVHSVRVQGDEPICALSWFEPPLGEGEDDRVPAR